MYDLIGDIHGHADELVQLLEALGYRNRGGVYAHPERQVIFLGDFIDRGPEIRQVLRIVRPMIEGGKALGVLGNHELNALAYHTPDPIVAGEFLRPHSKKNVRQHSQTIVQLTHEELHDALEWFRTLPLWLDLGGLRVVHACWNGPAMKTIAAGLDEHGGLTTPFLRSACQKGQPLYEPVELILKGREAELPEGHCYYDKDGERRSAIRTRWYLPALGHTYRTYALASDEIDCDQPLDERVVAGAEPYPNTAAPVFVDHYWLSASKPGILAANVACLDYSVAKGGFLCAYRWQGQRTLENQHFRTSAR